MITFEEFKAEFDADLASMTEDELMAELEKAGCVFPDPWLFVSFDDAVSAFPGAANSNELALAA